MLSARGQIVSWRFVKRAVLASTFSACLQFLFFFRWDKTILHTYVHDFVHGMTNLLNMHLQIGWKICELQARSPVIVIGKLVATSLSIDFSCHPQMYRWNWANPYSSDDLLFHLFWDDYNLMASRGFG